VRTILNLMSEKDSTITSHELAIINQFTLEAQEFLMETRTGKGSIGDARLVVLDGEFAAKHQVSDIARLVIDDHGEQIYAGPAKFPDTGGAVERRKTTNYIDFFTAFAKNEALPDITDRLLKDDGWSSQVNDVYASEQNHYEKQLLINLSREYPIITLTNPSVGTAYRAHDLEIPFQIEVTATERDPKYEETLKRILEQSSRASVKEIPLRFEQAAVRYTGSNGAHMHLPNAISLCPNPFGSVLANQAGVSVVETEEGIDMAYVRKGRSVTAALRYENKYFVYSPVFLDQYLGRRKRSFYLFSSNHQKEMQTQKHFGNLNSYYLQNFPPYVPTLVRGKWESVSEDENYVYDIYDNDVYLTRRYWLADYAKYVGKEVAPFSARGNYRVTWYDSAPIPIPFTELSQETRTLYARSDKYRMTHPTLSETNEGSPAMVYVENDLGGEVFPELPIGSVYRIVLKEHGLYRTPQYSPYLMASTDWKHLFQGVDFHEHIPLLAMQLLGVNPFVPTRWEDSKKSKNKFLVTTDGENESYQHHNRLAMDGHVIAVTSKEVWDPSVSGVSDVDIARAVKMIPSDVTKELLTSNFLVCKRGQRTYFSAASVSIFDKCGTGVFSCRFKEVLSLFPHKVETIRFARREILSWAGVSPEGVPWSYVDALRQNGVHLLSAPGHDPDELVFVNYRA